MNLRFSISELCIIQDPEYRIPIEIADKILYHIGVVLPIRNIMGCPIWASQNSGYRPYEYEKRQGRSGNSEHVFHGMGAIDWTTEKKRVEELRDLLERSEYKRVCWYPDKHFIHCDFKGDDKVYFECYDGINWVKK